MGQRDLTERRTVVTEKGHVLDTERLFLREMSAEDFVALKAVLGDPVNMQHYPYVFDDSKIMNWIERNVQRYRTFGFGLWAVCIKETDEMIGDCGLTMQNIHGVIRPEIGYHIRRDMQRKGYAKEAAEAVRDMVFMNLPFNEIYSYMKYTNEPSQKTAVSWGCSFLERYEDPEDGFTDVYMITREDWEHHK
ncbi:MAG: GNAT family N-acetyltransferase [Oscillospiraceae bacterium]|nr:GNAT family N-acetyltransferase [Oscillospiraceae bacterium]